MGLVTVTPATGEPVTLEEAKTQLSLSSKKWDDFLSSLIEVANEVLEREASLRLFDTVLEWQQDFFPRMAGTGGFHGGSRGIVYLPLTPISAVNSVKYVDTDGTEKTLPTAEYDVDIVSIQGRLRPAEGFFWPVTNETMNAVKIEFVAGYGDEAKDIPKPLRQVILMAVADMFENRESQIAETFSFKKNPTFSKIISLYALRSWH